MRSATQRAQQTESRFLELTASVLARLDSLHLTQSSTKIENATPLTQYSPASVATEGLPTDIADLQGPKEDGIKVAQDEDVDQQSLSHRDIHSTLPHRQQRPPAGCKSGCHCLCHQPYISRLAIARCLGQARINIRGLPLLSGRCTDPSCAGPSSNVAIEACFRFPPWLLSKAVSLSILSSRWHQPCLNLRIRNVLPNAHPWYQAFIRGDIAQARQLLVECPSRVNDINERGMTALMVSLFLLDII